MSAVRTIRLAFASDTADGIGRVARDRALSAAMDLVRFTGLPLVPHDGSAAARAEMAANPRASARPV